MAMKTKAGSSPSSASSWWEERSKIIGKKTETTKARPVSKKKVRTKKAVKAEKGQTYYCEICGSEMVCVQDSMGEILCCDEPMCVVCG